MVVFQGWGLLGLLIPALLAGLGSGIGSAFTKTVSGINIGALIGGALGVLCGSLVVWFLGKRLNDAPPRTLVGSDGSVITYVRRHTLFWIPLQYWAFVAPPVIVICALVSMGSNAGNH